MLVAFHLAVGADDLVTLVDRAFKIRRRAPVIVEVHAHAVGEIHADLHGVVGVDAVAHEAFLLVDGAQGDGLALVVVVDQIHPMRPHVAERVTLLDPLERARGNFERLFEVRRAVKRLANAFFDVVADSEVIRVVTFMHVHGDDAVLLLCEPDDFIGFCDVEAHRFFSDDVNATFERRENDFRVQMIWSGHRHHVHVREIAQYIQPRFVPKVRLGF